MNKFDLINTILRSRLNADDKNLLIELVLRTDYAKHGNWDCWPSVERLAQVRGIKHEKNFKGADVYLPGLVTKRKAGRMNVYTIDVQAISQLPQFEVTIKHTPAVADETPATAENTPAVEGANSTSNITRDISMNSTQKAGSAGAPPSSDLIDSYQSEDLRVDNLFLQSSDLDTPGGGPGRQAAQAAQEALDLFDRMTDIKLNPRERTEALSLMNNPRWRRDLKFPNGRAVAAHKEVLMQRETVW
jgi:hypothetical protein